jgi:hypothetical protein
MNPQEKLALQKMVTENNVQETTELIRSVKHSSLIREDVKMLTHLLSLHSVLRVSDPEKFDEICTSECSFLFNNYTDLYNKVVKEELDLRILEEFLVVLSKIEEGSIDQHQGSFEVGKLLKKLYIDSALRKSEHLDQGREEEAPVRSTKQISWRQYKLAHI